MRELGDVLLGLLDLDLRVSRDDTKACAWCIEEDSVKFGEHFWHFSSIIAHHYSVGDAQSVTIGVERLEPLFFQVICYENTRVFH